MNIAKPVSREVNKVSFAFYTSEDIRRLSVKSIFNPILFDNLNFPTRGGLYDLALGPFDKCSICTTCSQNYFECPGHFGHIDLPLPVYNAMFFNKMFKILQSMCLFCYKFRLGRAKKHLLQAKLLLLQKGLVLESIEIDNSIILDKELPSAQSDRRNGTTINSKLDWDKNVMDIDPVSDDDEAMEDNRLENDIENEADTGKKIKGKNAELQDVYIERIDAFMRKAFSRASMSKSNKLALHDKVALTTYHRQQTLKDLSKRFTAIKKCDNCSALAPRLRKDGCSKIFMIPLSKKLQQTMEAKGLRFSEAVVYRQLAALDAKAKLKENQTAETSINDSLPVESNTILSESDDSDAELERQFEELEGETIMQSQIRTAKLGTGGLTQIIIPSTQNPASNLYLNPALVQALLRLLWHNDQRLLDLMFSSTATETTYNDKSAPLSSYEMFFFNVLIVPPTKFRPVNKMEGAMFDHPQNTALAEAISCRQRIIESMKTIKELAQNVTDRALMKMKREETLVYLNSSWIALQGHINGIIDSTYNSNTGRQTKDPPPGIRQLLEKKEGIMRKHMMGKRVNYAARSVISPDPWIETCEIGIPPVFATKLTYPEPVTPHNVKELYQNVINGPDVWPGATHVQLQDGKLQLLTGLHLEARKALASQLLAPQQQSGSDALAYASHTNKKVYRHLRNGDVLLLNRQPTLHKPSIMAHKARILPGEKTIRLHYANCNTYNADFDGDEMNVHFPQNEMARAEASFIANTNNQYLVPTDGSPLRGLIQDHVVTGVKMSARDTFLDKEYYHQLLMGSLPEEVMRRGGVQLLPPAIMKPRPLWTGKQVISTLLLNLCRDMPALNLHSASKVPGKYWGPSGLEEGTVIFCDGEMVTGSLDKSQCGASAYGLVHVYGSEIAGHLLSTLGRLFSKYLQMFAFSCRMDDLLLTKTGDKWRRDLLDKGHMFGRDVAIQYTSLDDDIASGKLNDKEVDAQLKVRLEEVLREQEKLAGLDSAMKSKMNGLTSSVISKCLPEGLVKLFPENGMQLMTVSGAKGSNVNVSQISCLLGQQELEGRRVPIMVSGKSLPSFLPFDPSARAGGYIAGRFLTGIRPQEYYFHCMAGREGLIDTTVKTSRSGYLQRCLMKHMEGFRVHYDYSVRDAEGSVLQFLYGEDSLDVIKQKHLYQFRFCAENAQALNYRFNPASALAAIDDTKAIKYGKKMAKNKLRYDPVLSKYTPSRYLGATSEHFADQLTEYVNSNPDHLLAEKGAKKNPLTGKKFQALMRLKYLRSLIDPGEAVGVLAAQSIGEPSTQMTLNTFHFAGFGAKNVTLGIPRLREIVMSASANISTPTMMLPLLSHISHKDGEKFSKDLTRLTLSAILHEVIVKEKVTRMTSQKRVRQYTIRLSLFPKSDYKKVYDLDTSQVENALEKRFTKKLEQSILRHLKKAHKKDDSSNEVEELIMTVKEKTTSTNHVDEDGDVPNIKGQKEGNDDDDNDGDATASKYNNRAKQQATYDDPDEDENAIMKAADHQVDSDEDLDEPVITKDKTEQNDSDASDMDEMAHAPKNLNDSRDRNDVDNHRKHRIANDSAYITDYKFDSVHGEWCEFELQLPGQWKKLLMVDIIEQVCHSVIIRELPGISRCFVAQNETENDKSISLATDGVNLKGLWNHTNIIDVNKIYTNDIAALYHSYGVEAARSAIIKEVAGVFDVYGISVDRRHLSLIADYMTFEGGYKPFSRLGMQTNPSPLLKMSFETTCAFLTDATLSGDFDTLKSPSARLVVGKVVESGTGCFDVLQPLT